VLLGVYEEESNGHAIKLCKLRNPRACKEGDESNHFEMSLKDC
jgi:hypothetical protein